MTMAAVHRRLRVLLIAEAANPEWSSVPLVGWSLASALGRLCDATLVTQVRNAAAIGRATHPFQSVRYIDSEALARPLWKLATALRFGEGKGWTMLTAIGSLAYYDFERRLWRELGEDIRAGRYDLVHRITPLSPTSVSPIAAHCAAAGVPFVLGPLNGGVPWPAEFRAARHAEREWLSYVRGAYRLLPGRRAMLRHARAVMAGSMATLRELPEPARGRAVYLPENAIDPRRFPYADGGRDTGPLRVCFVGRLVPYKGLDMLLEATADLLARRSMTLDVVGDGPMSAALRAQAASLGSGDAVRFHGWLEHGAVHRVLGAAHVLGFPSVREFGGAVVLEAMALGVVPVVVDYAGPGELVHEDTGFKVPLGSRADVVDGLRERFTALCADRTALHAMAQAGRERVMRLFTWDAKARQVQEVYRWALDTSSPKPDFGLLASYAPGAPRAATAALLGA